MSARCREGHLSDEDDYCSVCGAPIAPARAPAPAPSASRAPARPAASATAGACPVCGEHREDPDARFCEVCRYDFVKGAAGPAPVARAQPNPQPAAAPPAPAPIAATPARSWELVIAVDPALDTDPDPASPCPKDVPSRTLRVDRPEMLVGRHDETRDIHPEVSLHDPGASRRHAKFVLDPDGGVALQDLASTNGTTLNGKEVQPGTRVRLKEGDHVTLGRWTRITLRGAS